MVNFQRYHRFLSGSTITITHTITHSFNDSYIAGMNIFTISGDLQESSRKVCEAGAYIRGRLVELQGGLYLIE